MVTSSSVDAEVEFTDSEEVVLIDSIGPWSTHSFTEWLVALGLLDSWVLLLLSVRVTAAAPTVVLKSEVLVFSTGCSASVLVVAVFLWTEFEVSSSIVTVAADRCPGWFTISGHIDFAYQGGVEVVLKDSISPWSSHISLILIAFFVSDLWILLRLTVAITAAAPTVVL
jgi:hypothetical protein